MMNRNKKKSSDKSRVKKSNSESIFGSENNNKRQQKFCKSLEKERKKLNIRLTLAEMEIGTPIRSA
jgi:hypothetical protein